jgi:hypothetical protein
MTKAIRKRELQPTFKKDFKPEARGYLVWDTKQGGLALSVQPSGYTSWKAIYNHHRRTRWYTIGSTEKIGLSDARKLTKTIMGKSHWVKTPRVRRRRPLDVRPLSSRSRRSLHAMSRSMQERRTGAGDRPTT